MKITIQQKDISIFSKRINHIIDSKISSGHSSDIFFIEASKGSNQILMQSSSPYMSAQYYVNSYVESQGKIILNTKSFLNFIKEISSGAISITQQENAKSIDVVKDNAQCSIPCETSVDTFSNEFSKGCDASALIKINHSELTALLNCTAYAASKDNSRAVLQSIMISISSPNQIMLTSSDGKRLAQYSSNAQITIIDKDVSEFIIPIKCMEEVEKHVLSMIGGDIHISLGKYYAEFTMDSSEFGGGKMIMSSRTIAESFPDISSIMPKDEETFTIEGIPKQDFINAIKITSAFTSGKYPSIKVCIKSDKLQIYASAPDTGKGVANIEINTKTKQEIIVGFNSTTLLSTLKKIESELISIKIKNPHSPCIIFGGSPSLVSGFTIVMPMRIT